jgi:hypothetical protein
MGPLLVGLRRKETVRRIGRHHASTERHVSENPVQVQRIPQRGMNGVPDIAQISALLVDAGRRHHEADPRVGQKHQRGADRVEHHRHAEVEPLEQALAHLVPAVIIDV